MALFTRRWLQLMLDDLQPYGNFGYRKRLAASIESSDTSTAISFAAELGVVWALSKFCSLEPLGEVRFDNYPPDAVATDLIAGTRTVIEVRAVSDDVDGLRASRPPTIKSWPFRVSRNVLGNAIADKDKKFSVVPDSHLRVTVIVNVGSRDAENPFGIPRQWNAAIGNDIITFAASKTKNTDAIVLLYWSPKFGNVVTSTPQRFAWEAAIYDLRGGFDLTPLDDLAKFLPPLRTTPDMLRQLHRHGDTSPQGRRVRTVGGMRWSREEGLSVIISARVFQDFLAQESELAPAEKEQFENFREMMLGQIRKGRVISDIRLERLGPDADDDAIAFSFDDDPAASALTIAP